MIGSTAKLDDIFSPGKPLPPDEVMIRTGLNILNHCPHGQQLAEFAKAERIAVKIMATPYPTTYLPDPHQAFIGFNRNNPISPSRFVLMLAGVLREAMQEAHGIRHPSLNAPLEEHMRISMAKQEDRVWTMCTIAIELNSLETFSEYNFLEELRKMGHKEALDLILKET